MDNLQLNIAKQLILSDNKFVLGNLSNLSSWIYHEFDAINWAGFYLYDGSSLVLGPFCGKVACTNIGWGKGVCGTALAQNKTIIVPDVHKFDGHIACDSASNSEIVVPMYLHDKPIGVLDIDSILLDRFDSSHQELFENIVRHLIQTNGNAISRLVANNE